METNTATASPAFNLFDRWIDQVVGICTDLMLITSKFIAAKLCLRAWHKRASKWYPVQPKPIKHEERKRFVQIIEGFQFNLLLDKECKHSTTEEVFVLVYPTHNLSSSPSVEHVELIVLQKRVWYVRATHVETAGGCSYQHVDSIWLSLNNLIHLRRFPSKRSEEKKKQINLKPSLPNIKLLQERKHHHHWGSGPSGNLWNCTMKVPVLGRRKWTMDCGTDWTKWRMVLVYMYGNI